MLELRILVLIRPVYNLSNFVPYKVNKIVLLNNVTHFCFSGPLIFLPNEE